MRIRDWSSDVCSSDLIGCADDALVAADPNQSIHIGVGMPEQGLPFAGSVEPNGDDGVTAVDLRQTDRPVAFRIDGKGIEPIMRDEVEGRQRLPAPAFTVPKEIAYPVRRIARSAGLRQNPHNPNLALALGDILDR